MLRAAGASLLHRCRGTASLQGVVARSFAEQAAEKVTIPITVHGTEGRYASALYSAAARAQQIDTVEKDLDEIWNLEAESEDFGKFVMDPSIPKTTKTEGLQAILGTMDVSDLTKRFLLVLAENGRLKYLDKIVDTFGKIVSAARGEVIATITTAEALEESELTDIKEGLGKLVREGQELYVEEQVDPSIIGGMILEVGDKRVDLSIRTKVRKVQQIITESF
eukprot:jgi/Astpho2/2740/Aster-00920